METFTPVPALVGGLLIGLSVSVLYGGIGRIAGITSIISGLSTTNRSELSWRALFLAGLVVGGVALLWIAPDTFASAEQSLPTLALAGVLVGYGARLGGGCTSGHGVCGNSRLSSRSLVATGVFMTTGAIVVFVVRHVLGGAL